jgi:hypothetical protein
MCGSGRGVAHAWHTFGRLGRVRWGAAERGSALAGACAPNSVRMVWRAADTSEHVRGGSVDIAAARGGVGLTAMPEL